MTLRAAALRYSEFLLRQITRAADRRRWDQVHSLCDRFERVMGSSAAGP